MPLYRAELLAKKPLRYAALIHDVSQVLYLPFDWDDGSYARDRSGYQNHGTIYGATLVAGKIGMARSFDGTDDYVEVPDDASLRIWSGDWAIAFWVKRSAPGGQLFFKYTGAGSGYVRIDASPAGSLTFYLYDGTTILSYSVSITDDVWMHYGITHEAATKTLTWFKDGVEQPPTTHTLTLANINPLGPIRLGHRIYWATWFDGIIDEVRTCERALSQDEIRMLMYRRWV